MASRSSQTGRPQKAGYLHHVLGILAGVLLVLNYGIASAQSAGLYTLKPGDVVSVTVLEDPLLDRQVLVAPDGRIALPLAGSLIAQGRTPQQLAGTVRARLRSRFVDPPTVTVSLVSIGEEDDADQRVVYVLGEVTRPGRYGYKAEEPITILQALTLAGGPSPFAATARIQVRERAGKGGIETLRLFDYEAAADGALNTVHDLAVLADGAVIIVPERGLFE